MKKIKTEHLLLHVEIIQVESEQVIKIIYCDEQGQIITENELKVSRCLCKQNFNDTTFAKTLFNFFIKD